MCFHTSQTKKVTALESRYNVTLFDGDSRDAFDVPRYHINGFSHPSMLIIPQEEPSKLVQGLWGIIPNNKKPEDISNYYKESISFGGGLNAQSEKLFSHFLYKNSALTKRCIIPVTGFFEPHEYKRKKYPFHFKSKDNELISLAGIYTWVEDILTFTILTKTASPLFAKIHNQKNRQPVILNEETEDDWLNDGLNEGRIKKIIESDFDENELKVYPVSKDLFSPKINSDVESIMDEVKYDELNLKEILL